MKKIQIVILQDGLETMLQCVETEDKVTLNLSVTNDGENIPIPEEEMYDSLEVFTYGLGEQMAGILHIAEQHFRPSGILLPPEQPDLFKGAEDAPHLRIVK